MRVDRRKRRGASVVVAELVMIAVVLIAVVMLGGFAFGLFGVYLSPALVYVQSGSCSSAGTIVTCHLTLLNEGARSTATTGSCSINEGSVVTGSIVGGGTVPAGGTLNGVQCVASGSSVTPGTQLSGALSLTNGAVLFFTGTAQ